MKHLFILLILGLMASAASAQLGVSYHQSSVPYLGINYELNNQYMAEVRVGANNYFEHLAFELTANYFIVHDPSYDLYGGIGGRTTHFAGLVVPVGVNLYPFDNKDFGFHIEAAGMFGETAVFRADWGIRYRFGSTGVPSEKEEE